MQSYFTSSVLKQEDKRTIFRYRVRMERFGENFRGGAPSILCLLCSSHQDNQEMSFHCPTIKNGIYIKGIISEIYKKDISNDRSGAGGHLGCSGGYNFNLYKEHLSHGTFSQGREQLHSKMKKLVGSLIQMEYSTFMLFIKLFFGINNLRNKGKL